MKIIGLTGGIGSGKSFVSEQFKKFGAAVYNSDSDAKYIEDFWPEAQDGLKKLFGPDIYLESNRLDKRKVAGIVFTNPDMLQKLNELIHPLVKISFDNFVKANADKKFVVFESAILVQSGFHKSVDFCILVKADESVRIQRVMKRDNCTGQQVLQRIRNQADDSDVQKFCKYTILNNGDDDIKSQIKKILDEN